MPKKLALDIQRNANLLVIGLLTLRRPRKAWKLKTKIKEVRLVSMSTHATPQQGNSASAQKINLPSATPTSSTINLKEKVSGFRFVDIGNF